MLLVEAYAELETEPGASAEEVRQARNILLKVWHPDRHQHDAKLRVAAEKKTVRINEAFRIIEDAKFPSAADLPKSEPEAPSAEHREYELKMRELDLRERELFLKEQEAARPRAHEWVDKKVKAAGQELSNLLVALAWITIGFIGLIFLIEIVYPGSTK